MIQSCINNVRNYPTGHSALPIIGNLYKLGAALLANLTTLDQKYGSIFQIFREISGLLSSVTSRPLGSPFKKTSTILQADVVCTREIYLPITAMRSCVENAEKDCSWSRLKRYIVGIEKLENGHYQSDQEVFRQFDLSKGEPQDPHHSISSDVVNASGSRFCANDLEFRTVLVFTNTFAETLGLGNLVDILPAMKYVSFDSENIRRLKKAVIIE